MIFQSIGRLRYSEPTLGVYRLVLEIDSQINAYYLSLVPKYFALRSQKHGSHITVCRPFREEPTDLGAWRKHEGVEIVWCYSSTIRFNDSYAWLDVWSLDLERVRRELGLSLVNSVEGPWLFGYIYRFHTTLGNFKEL